MCLDILNVLHSGLGDDKYRPAPILKQYVDVIVLGDDDEAVRTVMEITTSIPRLRALDGGSLRNAVGMETFAAVLLTVNVRHKMRGSLRLQTV